MISNLHRLVYMSRNEIDGDGATVRREIEDILSRARTRNERAGVTGALIFNSGCFAQVLEGRLASIEEIFERIQCDLRHSDVVVLAFHPIPQRRFGRWSMAYVGGGPAALAEFADIGKRTGFDARELAGERVLELLEVQLLAA